MRFSGNLVHNLHAYAWGSPTVAADRISFPVEGYDGGSISMLARPNRLKSRLQTVDQIIRRLSLLLTFELDRWAIMKLACRFPSRNYV